MTKKEIRIIYKQKRRKLSAPEKEKLEDLMLIQFQKLPNFNIKVLMSYVPITAQNEYDPYLPENWLSIFYNNPIFVYPKMFQISNSMIGYIVDDETVFETNNYGIAEPMSVVKIDEKDIDVMFIPLIAFDKNGHRVGYGKGYYDRYLQNCKPNLIKIGFSFFDEVTIDDVRAYDQKLDYCITPNKLYTF